MSSTMGVEEFLQRSLPEWSDDTRMQARLRAFSTQDENFESHFEFWRGVILLVARAYLQASIIKTEEVRTKQNVRRKSIETFVLCSRVAWQANLVVASSHADILNASIVPPGHTIVLQFCIRASHGKAYFQDRKSQVTQVFQCR